MQISFMIKNDLERAYYKKQLGKRIPFHFESKSIEVELTNVSQDQITVRILDSEVSNRIRQLVNKNKSISMGFI